MNNARISTSAEVNPVNQQNQINQGLPPQIDDKSPEELKDKIEEGEITEKDFKSPEDFLKFIQYLSRLLGMEIIPKTEKAMITQTDEKIRLELDNKSKSSASDTQMQTKTITENTDKLKVLNEEKNVKQENTEVKSRNAQDTEVKTPKEGVTTPMDRRDLSQMSAQDVKQAPQTSDIDLFKMPEVDTTLKNDKSLQISDKGVTLHVNTSTNLSMSGNEIGAQGDVAFLESAREFADQEGFSERGGQEQSPEEDVDLDKVYFSKDGDR